MSSSQLYVEPPRYPMFSTETLPLAIEMSFFLEIGDTVTSPVCSLLDLVTDLEYPAGLSGPPVVAGTSVVQTVTGLVEGHTYRLLVTFTAAVGKIRSAALLLDCEG